ncbi:cyclic nucleotide-binding domain-containing protein [uncultured Pseudodesulfovibrio sp.]|uniref:cyclic nucleotide-binding domain-containing protein n=1 Tax=uncultured Pseudodesulfovibrio sp. TaxID=2035858 RepID=UPI0029C9A5ED|nr:cyclic nucleotide-binding domain-containing protein [uncultured Pseudodesulfovibrio sp.]
MNIEHVDWPAITLFKTFPSAALEKIKPLFDVRSYEAGENLITEGDVGDEMFILIRGRVRITKSMFLKGMNMPILEVDNPRKVLATMDETEYPLFGEIALIDTDTRSATIQTLDQSHFLVTDRQKFFDFLDREPAIGNKLFMTLAKRMTATIRKNNTELVKLSTALALALSRFKTSP